MFQNNPLLAQLKQELHEQTPRVEGTIRAHEKGFGFLDVDNKKSYFIPIAKMKRVCNGDKVSGTVISNNDKESFEPESLIESALQKFIGKIGFQDRTMVIYPENMSTNLAIRCKINKQVSEKLKEGDWVVATLVSHPLQEKRNQFLAEIVHFVAESNSPYRLWLKTLARYDLETHAPQFDSLSINGTELDNRQDLTDVNFFTIDSEDTEDMDDAIAISKGEQGDYQLTVAIADPTAYVLQDSELDRIAKIRNFTTYLPDFNIPMLPKELANDLCSLKANQKRPAMICKMGIDETGNINSDEITFIPAWIESKAKLTYNNVSNFLENNEDLETNNPIIKQQLKHLADLAKIRMTWRQNHALVFKDNGDYRFELDENRQVKSIIKESRRIANQIVEEVMVLANQALTLQLKNKIGFGIFNIHSGFDNKYIEQVATFLNDNGITEFDKESLLSFDGYVKLRRIIDNTPFLSTKLRKFQSPADFSTEPKPHFGLGFDAYATWTSPIRKYGDMVNHRLIKAFIRSQELVAPDKDQLKNMNERRKTLRYAERDMAENLYAQYLSNKVGESFSAEIIDINRGGARVRLCDIGAFAFMPLSMIHSVKEEIISLPEEGIIKIKDEVCYKLADTISVVIHQVKSENQSIITKLANN
ncbi:MULTISPECIES: exoribonuclease II [unclassified Gilliamella]|uniref:exoribonuclease II n=1 Tax=unclassified Gilliamella TaxID=2685620 RepID=UPI00080E8672|nr:exoribonuclease II [Gilliamella apicola]OCG33930.1 exoribonuclease II [Gilliamella apicola]OCG50229.1 exoribonuclease II [Gilliamella apicola]OCG52904.1 exoribonuclease II [Gilliamella apicola]